MKLSLPLEAYHLAERYRLGTPVKMEATSIGFLLSIIGLVSISLPLMVGVIVTSKNNKCR